MAELLIKIGDAVVNKYIFDKDVVSIGRAKGNDIVLENLSVSRNHARIKKEGDQYFIVDLNSANGTFVNGVKITKTTLQNNDVIAIGKYRLIFINKGLSDQEKIFDISSEEQTMIIEEQGPTAKLIVIKGKGIGKKYNLDKEKITIGRGPDNDIVLRDLFIGKHHATIYRRGNRYYLCDEGSWRGTQVNGESITEIPLMDGDIVKIGGWEFEFNFSKEEQIGGLTGRIPVDLGKEEQGSDESGFFMIKDDTTISKVSSKEEIEIKEEKEEMEEDGTHDSYVNIPQFMITHEENSEEEEEQGSEDSQIIIFDKESDYVESKSKDTEKLSEKPKTEEEHVEEYKEKVEETFQTKEDYKEIFKNVEKGSYLMKIAEQLDFSNTEIRKWFEGLKSSKKILRNYSAKQLEKLTGIKIDVDRL